MRHLTCRGAAVAAALALTILTSGPGALAQSAEGGENSNQILTAVSAAATRQVGIYSEGMIRITDGINWGYADSSGAPVIQPQFSAAEDFYLGVALVKQNGKTGLLRWDGTFLFQPQYDELTGLGYGVYLGKHSGQWDLLSVAPVEGTSHQILSNLTVAALGTGSGAVLTMLGADGTLTQLPVSSLPQLLKSRQVPGWQFPLSASRKAAFQDVPGSAWYARWVNLAYNVGLMEGADGNKFEPLRTLTVAEALRLAACLESRALQDDFHLQSVSGPYWYGSSVAYCEASGVITPGEFGDADFNRPVTRAEMARIFSATTPVRGMEVRNSLDRVRASVPDVSTEDYAAEDIYGLYAKGILNGTDRALSFRPESSLTRAEAAAIVSRIARPEQRITLW